jgi:hypothetical protein
MPVIAPALSRAFILGVKLPAAPAGTRSRSAAVSDTPPLDLKSTEAQSLVVGSGLIAAAQNVPQQTREDLVNCTLFAQLAASGAVTDPQRIAEWYAAYFKTLTAIGWAQSDTQFEEYDFKSKTAEAHKAIIKVLTVLLGPQAAALVVVQTVLEALQSMNEDSPWITLFDRQSKTGKSARFQVATAQIDPGGLLQIALVGFELVVKASLTQVLFVKYASNSTHLKYAAGKATIYEAALRDQREALAARLAAYRSAYVAQIPLPPLPTLPPPPGAGTRSVSRGAGATTESLSPEKVSRLLLE